jgi:predicted DNA-binding protein (MmcQ/YjbR family)
MPNQTQTTTVINHIRTEYAVEPEFLWPERFPTYSVFRHADNKKWFALVASIPSISLGLKNGKTINPETITTTKSTSST